MLQHVSALIPFIWMNDIPLYGYTTLFTHSTFELSPFLTIIKNGIVNIRTFYVDMFSVFLGIYLRNRIAGIHVNFIFNSLRNCQAFSEVDKPFQILTNNVLGLRFLFHIFVNTFYCPLDYPF